MTCVKQITVPFALLDLHEQQKTTFLEGLQLRDSTSLQPTPNLLAVSLQDMLNGERYDHFTGL